jgi:hypothetical protein
MKSILLSSDLRFRGDTVLARRAWRNQAFLGWLVSLLRLSALKPHPSPAEHTIGPIFCRLWQY